MSRRPARDPDRPRAAGPGALAGLAVLVLAAALVLAGTLGVGRATTPGTYLVEVPAGTGVRLAAGEPVQLLPADLELEVGTELVITNFDRQDHEVGPFLVRAGETFRHRFTSPGTFVGNCSIHPSGDLRISVV